MKEGIEATVTTATTVIIVAIQDVEAIILVITAQHPSIRINQVIVPGMK